MRSGVVRGMLFATGTRTGIFGNVCVMGASLRGANAGIRKADDET